MTQQPPITDDWVDRWFVDQSCGDGVFLCELRGRYAARRDAGDSPPAAFAATVRQYAIFADIKV